MQIFANATVYTLAHPDDCHEALVVDGGKVAYVGSLAEARDLAPGSHEVDCGGSIIIPGLVDSHIHAISTAATLTQVDLRTATSLDEAVRRIADHASTMTGQAWVTGGRWDANKWNDTGEPNRELLDQLVPDRPVAVWSIDFHTLWLNGAALNAVGIDDHTPDPRGGRIVRDSHGKATGVLKEDAATVAERTIPHDPLDRRVAQMDAGQKRWLAEGITTVHDFDSTASRQAWEELDRAGNLDIRVVKYLRLDEWEWAKNNMWRTGDRYSDRYLKGGLKLFSDGALGSHTCHMTTAFNEHHPEPNYGLPIASPDVLIGQITDAHEHGVATAIHAIGDQANRDVLTAYRATADIADRARRHFGTVLRNRIEHAQYVQDTDLADFSSLGIIAAMQPRHCISDIPLQTHLSESPGRRAYPWKDLRESGAILAFGSDAPVEPTTPFGGIYAAMTRADIAGDPATTFQADKRISTWDAIRAHTTGSAYAAGLERETGTLTPGMNADFIAIDVDPFRAPGGNGITGAYDSESALFDHGLAVRDAHVSLTVVNGQVVYRT